MFIGGWNALFNPALKTLLEEQTQRVIHDVNRYSKHRNRI
jgi:hypothetical protein